MVALAAIVAALWAIWLLRDRLEMAAAIAPAAAVVLGVSLWILYRRVSSAAFGTLRVDDLGQVLWESPHRSSGAAESPGVNGSPAPAGSPSPAHATSAQTAVPRQWHRTERSVWLRLEVADPQSAGSASPAATIDLTIGIGDIPTTDWVALHRWLLWMERGIAH